MPLRQPTTHIVRRLAFGGMAELYVVASRGQERSGPFRVVKQILAHLQDDPTCQEMFLLEGELGLRLNHPNIVRTLAVGTRAEFDAEAGLQTTPGRPYIMLEYLDGLDLRAVLKHLAARGERMSPQTTLAIGVGLADGLAHAHAGGAAALGAGHRAPIIHRDVTPSNIMLTVDGGVKLIDFGVATVGTGTAMSHGYIKGKLSYMSPEQVADAPIDGRSDQYALALVLWECLAGEACYPSGHHFATLLEVAQGRARRIENVRMDLPEALCAILGRALSMSPSDRFADMGQMAQGLRGVMAALGSLPQVDTALLRRARKAVGSDLVWGRDQTTKPMQVPVADGVVPVDLGFPARGWAV